MPFKAALTEHWQLLKSSRDAESIARSLKKEKWDDVSYFLAQDVCLGRLESSKANGAVFKLAVMGFVRVTCARSGSMGRDWFDRKGLVLLWVGRNVLSVKDFTWAKDAFMIELPSVEVAEPGPSSADATLEDDVEAVLGGGMASLPTSVQAALRGEVELQRVKKHYFEKYEYAS